MEPIQIEKGVPFPSGRGDAIYPFMEMEVGDSFQATVAGAREDARLRAKAAKPREGRKFACRKVGENTIRVWRIK